MSLVGGPRMGIELDVLIGHPEHDLMFIATQVARAAGLKNPKTGMASARRTANGKGFVQVNSLVSNPATLRPDRVHAPTWSAVWLATESAAYQMLLRGHAPQSEPFREWITEVVLPSIRKTGKFDVNEATDETSQQFAGEFSAIHAALVGFRDEVMAKITPAHWQRA